MLQKHNLPGISFVVIDRNNEQYVVACLTSLLRILEGLKGEIVFVDDASTDGSGIIAKKMLGQVYEMGVHTGIAGARKKGIKAAKNDFVVIIDSDIELVNFDWKKIYTLFQERSNLIGVTGRYYSPTWSEGRYNWNRILDIRREQVQYKGDGGFYFDISRYTTFSGGFCVLNKKKLLTIKGEGVINQASEDLFMQLEFAEKGYSFAYTPLMLGKHHHYRSFVSLVKKCVSEAKGEVWLFYTSLRDGFKIPVFDPVYSFPFMAFLVFWGWQWLAFSLITNIFLFFRYLSWEFALLLCYQMLKDYYKGFWFVRTLFSFKYGLVSHLKYVVWGGAISILGKVDWFLRRLSREKLALKIYPMK